MSNFEFNKLSAAVLVSGLIAMTVGNVADMLYYGENKNAVQKRGYAVAVQEGSSEHASTDVKEEFKIDIQALLKTASVEAGKSLSAKCVSCHSFDKGGANKVGPHLWGVIHRARGTAEGYNYSNAMKNLGGNWGYEEMAMFLHKPSVAVPGTKMTFAGLSKPEDIANIIAYLKTLSDNPEGN
jgi:cytochrome c